MGQLKTAKGWELGGSAARSHEQFGYAYDAEWNLNYRTNNALAQSFGVNSLNQLTNLSRSGTHTVAGAVSITPTNVTVKDNANAAQAATVYTDEAFTRTNVTLLNGNNTFQAVAKDSLGRVDTNTVTAYLPSSAVCAYDSRGNLTNDGRRVFYYDSENQLTNVLVAGQWKSEFGYDGLMRRKVRKEFTWSGSAWVQTNEVRYIYDGRLVIEERHYTPHGSTLIPLNTVTYTRGNDLSGTLEGAGGIGGLLARSETLSSIASGGGGSTAYYHADGNGNVTALVNTNGLVVARYSYDPYGTILGMSGPLAERNLYRFSSKEWHEKSGLIYYLYRCYDPGLQRWVNRDPLGDVGSLATLTTDTVPLEEESYENDLPDVDFQEAWTSINRNLHTMVGNNPLNTVDSFGLAECPNGLGPGSLNPENLSALDTRTAGEIAKAAADRAKQKLANAVQRMIKQAAKDGRRSVEKSIRSYKKAIEKHEKAIAEKPNSRSVDFWKKEIENIKTDLEAAEKVLKACPTQ
jgi:RHS repeat-associated protein